MVKTFLIGLFLTFSFLGQAQQNWQHDIEAAKTEAQASNKAIFLYFSGSDWCAPCIKLKRDILETEGFKAFSDDNLVMLKADFPRKKANQLDKEQQTKNDALAEKYNSTGIFPLSVLINAKGEVLGTWEGFPSGLTTAKFIEEIQKTSQKKTN